MWYKAIRPEQIIIASLLLQRMQHLKKKHKLDLWINKDAPAFRASLKECPKTANNTDLQSLFVSQITANPLNSQNAEAAQGQTPVNLKAHHIFGSCFSLPFVANSMLLCSLSDYQAAKSKPIRSYIQFQKEIANVLLLSRSTKLLITANGNSPHLHNENMALINDWMALC